MVSGKPKERGFPEGRSGHRGKGSAEITRGGD